MTQSVDFKKATRFVEFKKLSDGSGEIVASHGTITVNKEQVTDLFPLGA